MRVVTLHFRRCFIGSSTRGVGRAPTFGILKNDLHVPRCRGSDRRHVTFERGPSSPILGSLAWSILTKPIYYKANVSIVQGLIFTLVDHQHKVRLTRCKTNTYSCISHTLNHWFSRESAKPRLIRHLFRLIKKKNIVFSCELFCCMSTREVTWHLPLVTSIY